MILLCWGESQGSGIHDHHNSECFVKILDGELTETLYAWPKENESGEELKCFKKVTAKKNEVTFINGKKSQFKVFYSHLIINFLFERFNWFAQS